eukprot:NODE_17_length_41373_cov_0.337016.p4 type:complete len:623 gc:universal NODE_17_length_41373_cov_0.337016:38977-37109(-)
MSSRACSSCFKTVYIVEELRANNVLFHQNCFKCKHCNSTITLSNFAAANGSFYCKPHYQQLFKSAGGKYVLDPTISDRKLSKDVSLPASSNKPLELSTKPVLPRQQETNSDENNKASLRQIPDNIESAVSANENDLKNKIKQYEVAVTKSTEIYSSSERLAKAQSNENVMDALLVTQRSLSVSSSVTLFQNGSVPSLNEGVDRRKSFRLKEKLKTPGSSMTSLFTEEHSELHQMSSSSTKNIVQALSSVINEEEHSMKESDMTVTSSRKNSNKQTNEESFDIKSLSRKSKISSSGLSLHEIAPKENIMVEKTLQPLRNRMAVLERSVSMKSNRSGETVLQIKTGTPLKDRLSNYQKSENIEKETKAITISRSNSNRINSRTLGRKDSLQRASRDFIEEDSRDTSLKNTQLKFPDSLHSTNRIHLESKDSSQFPNQIISPFSSSIKDRMNSYQQNLKIFEQNKGTKAEAAAIVPIEVTGEQSAIKARMMAYQSSLRKFEENQGEKFVEKEEKIAAPAVDVRKEEFAKRLKKDFEFNIDTLKKDLFKGDNSTGYIQAKTPEQKKEISEMVEKVVKKTIKIKNGESVKEDEPKFVIPVVEDLPKNVDIEKRMNIWEQRIQQSNTL